MDSLTPTQLPFHQYRIELGTVCWALGKVTGVPASYSYTLGTSGCEELESEPHQTLPSHAELWKNLG